MGDARTVSAGDESGLAVEKRVLAVSPKGDITLSSATPPIAPARALCLLVAYSNVVVVILYHYNLDKHAVSDLLHPPSRPAPADSVHAAMLWRADLRPMYRQKSPLAFVRAMSAVRSGQWRPTRR